MLKLTLKLNGSTQTFELEQEEITLGRSAENTITISNKKVSRKHAKIERVGAGFQVVDLESGNGTRVNGEKVDFHPVKKGDVIKIGDGVLTVDEIDDEPEGIQLDDDDEQDLLPTEKDVHSQDTEAAITPPDVPAREE